MSHLTNVLLLSGRAAPMALDPWLEQISAWDDGGRGPYPLVSFADARLPTRWTGGDAPVESAIALGAIDHLPLEAFVAFLRGLSWDDLGHPVQLAIMDEEDDEFQIIPIYPLRLADPDLHRAQAIEDLLHVFPSKESIYLEQTKFDELDAKIRRYLELRGIRFSDQVTT